MYICTESVFNRLVGPAPAIISRQASNPIK